MLKIDLLKELCNIHSPSGEEFRMKEFLMEYIFSNKNKWKTNPEIFHGEDFLDCIVLKFGTPRTALFAHMDSIGFTVGYNNELIKIGSPRTEDGYVLVGEDSKGYIEATLKVEEKDDERIIKADFKRTIDRGTSLVFKCNFRETEDFIQSCYLDNRLGVYNALKTAETLQDGLILFSCWEEHGGGSVEFLARFMYEKFRVRQALISDITWITNGVLPGKGVAISLRDSGIPRKLYLNKIVDLAEKSAVPYQLEVESAGGSDGTVLQRTPYPIDWCFVGAPEDNVHSPNEKVHKNDARAMHDMYRYLMDKL